MDNFKSSSKIEDLVVKKLKSYFEKAPHGAIAAFCGKSGIPRGTLKNWLAGTTLPLAALDAISKGLGVPPWQLLIPSEGEAGARGELRKMGIEWMQSDDELRGALAQESRELAAAQKALTTALARISELEDAARALENLSPSARSILAELPSLDKLEQDDVLAFIGDIVRNRKPQSPGKLKNSN